MSQFDAKAADWDDHSPRVQMALGVAEAIVRAVSLNTQIKAMELGCGTGIAATFLADKVASITAVDTSRGMLDILREKIQKEGYSNITPILADLTAGNTVEGPFDLIYSMMAFHHIAAIEALLSYFYGLLNPGGIVAIADLDAEDGSFHSPDSQYEHKGFDREAFKKMLKNAGFSNIADRTAFVMPRETETGVRDFPIFLITAEKVG